MDLTVAWSECATSLHAPYMQPPKGVKQSLLQLPV